MNCILKHKRLYFYLYVMLCFTIVIHCQTVEEEEILLANMTAWPTGINAMLSTKSPATVERQKAGSSEKPSTAWTNSPNSTESGNENKNANTAFLVTTDKVMEKLYVAIGAIGILGNGLTCIVLLSSRKLRKSFSSLFILNQSILDGLAAVFLILNTVLEYDGRFLSQTTGNFLLCSLFYSRLTLWGVFNCSTYNLLALSVERCMKVVHPIFHRAHFSRVQFRLVIAVVWLFGFLCDALYVIPTSRIVDNKCQPHIAFPSTLVKRIIGIQVTIVKYIIPLCVLIYVYSKMAYTLRNNKVTTETGPGASSASASVLQIPAVNTLKLKYRRSTIKTLAIVSSVFIFCWTANQLLFLCYNLGVASDLSGPFYHFSVILVFLNCCLNPLIYTLKYQAFQQAAQNLFCCWSRRPEVGGQHSSTANPTGITND